MNQALAQIRTAAALAAFTILLVHPALAQEGAALTSLQIQITSAAKGWETKVMDAARSLF